VCVSAVANDAQRHPATSITTWSTVLLEKPTVVQMVKKFPLFYVICRFIILFTTAHHDSQSQTK
jgi:hypothetical protein